MFFLVVFIGFCLWGVREAVGGKRRTPKQPSSLIPKTPQRLSLEAAIRKIAGGEISEEKLNALMLDAPHILVQARAGSGKTQTITLKAALAIQQGINSQNILCLSFNRSAANELSTRLARLGANEVPASTFHALAFNLIRPRPGSLLFGKGQRSLMRSLITGRAVQRAKRAGDDAIDELTEDVLIFISNAKHKGLTVEAVQTRCGGMGGIASQAASLYERYTNHLCSRHLIDFDDLIALATAKLNALERLPVVRLNGKVCNLNALRLVCLDESQDLSRSFYGLIKTLTDRNSSMGVYAVGDNWQAINSFAGSDLSFFNQFETYFPGAKRAQLQTNYRSRQNIVDYSNRWMKGQGMGGVALKEGGVVQQIKISGGGIGGVSVHQAVREMVTQERGRSVLVLARRNICCGRDLLAWQKDVELIHPNVHVSTIHGIKGGEADVVFFLKEPSRTDRLSCLSAVLGQIKEEIQAEEKRLVYVGFTRARDRLVVVE